MARRSVTARVAGMGRDAARGASDPRLSFESMNVRVVAGDEDNGALCVTGERGTERLGAAVRGVPVGTFATDGYLGVLSYEASGGGEVSHITVYSCTGGEAREYWHWDSSGSGSDLGFRDVPPGRRVESVVSVEAENSVRVYWADGVHELRVVDFMRLRSEGGRRRIPPGYFSALPPAPSMSACRVGVTAGHNGHFRSGTVQLFLTAVINGNETNVLWQSPLHYCRRPDGRAFAPDASDGGNSFTVQVTSRGFPTYEEDADPAHPMRLWRCVDYLVVYAVHRATDDGAPVAVRSEVALTVGNAGSGISLSFFHASAVLTGSEESADPDHIRMLNRRRPVGVRTLAQKDGLLFMGGFGYPAGQDPDSAPMDVFASYKSDIINGGYDKRIGDDGFNGRAATHTPQLELDSYTIGHFKLGESYALGIQLMDECGHWGAVIPVTGEDGSCLHKMTLPPKAALDGPKSDRQCHALPFFKAEAWRVAAVLGAHPWAVAVRPVVAYLDPSQARYKMQGFATPTIYCEKERADGLCHAKLSPFARPMKYFKDGRYAPTWSTVNPPNVIVRKDVNGWRVAGMYANVYLGSPGKSGLRTALGYQPTSLDIPVADLTVSGSMSGGTLPASQHWAALGCVKDYNCELQTSWYYRDVVFKSALIPCSEGDAESGVEDGEDEDPVYGQDGDDICTHDNAGYYVDASTVTLHSPDIEDWTSLPEKCGVEIVGAAQMTGFASDTSIVATGPHLNNSEKYGGNPGFQHLAPHSASGGGRCAMNLPNWVAAWEADWGKGVAPYWAVPPFGVADFLNAEYNQKTNADRSTSKLTYHQLANYRYCGSTGYYPSGAAAKYECDARVCDGQSPSAVVMGDDKRVYKPAEDVAVVPNLASMWSNGPYYFCRLGDAPLGIRSVGKFNDLGMAWTWAMYATVWLRRKEDTSPLDFNFVSLLSVGDYWTDGYWSHDGTVDDFRLLYGGKSISGPRQKRGKVAMGVWTKELNTDDRAFNLLGDSPMRIGNEDTKDISYKQNYAPKTYSVNLKYCSTPHAVLSMPGDAPMPNYGSLVKWAVAKCGEAGKSLFASKGWRGGDALGLVGGAGADIDVSGWGTLAPPLGESDNSDSLWVFDVVNNGGDQSFTPSTAQWMVAGEPVYRRGAYDVGDAPPLCWKQGDWYYQRWDCLRAYPKSVEDASQVVEIVSVMLETRRNVDARWDSHRGTAFLQASPSNFNLLNGGTQLNNFLTFAAKGEFDNIVDSFPCTVTWGLPKTLNSNIDAWTRSMGVSTLDLDGDKGAVTALAKYGNQVYCFQPCGVSLISYNNRTQVSAGDGLPVELAASGAVDGKVYISDCHGASTNSAVAVTETGVYFSDSYSRQLCRLSDSLAPLSDALGLGGWARSLPSMPSLVYPDRRSGRVMFDVGDGRALGFSERGGVFEGFYSLGGATAPAVVGGDTIAAAEGPGGWELWRLGTGPYNSFFGVDRPFWVDYLLCGGGAWDKVWDVVEFCGDVFEDGEFRPRRCPFNLIRAYTEYQDSGERPLEFRRNMPSPSKNLFRTWRAYVPRDATARRPGKVAERIRNPWAHIVLKYDPSLDAEGRRNDMARIEELTVHYNEGADGPQNNRQTDTPHGNS